MSNAQSALKATIHRMVREAIREILPEVMNEVLIRTLANSGVVSERTSPAPRREVSQPRPARKDPPRKGSLREALFSEDAGAEFYGDTAEPEWTSPVPKSNFIHEDPLRQNPALAQRISQLPSALQQLAEETFMGGGDDDAGEMWGDDEWAPTAESVNPQAPALNIDHAARVAQVDFSHIQRLVRATEAKAPRKDPTEVLQEKQWELQRLERRRQELDRKA